MDDDTSGAYFVTFLLLRCFLFVFFFFLFFVESEAKIGVSVNGKMTLLHFYLVGSRKKGFFIKKLVWYFLEHNEYMY